MENKNSIMTDNRVIKSVIGVLVILTIFLVSKTANEIRRYGAGDAVSYDSISVNGKGEVFAVPDIASFSYSVTKEATTAPEAQRLATEIHNKTIDVLRVAGVEDKDIEALPNVYPKYSYQNSVPCTSYSCPSNQVISGYEATFSVNVKVRKADDIGEIITKIGEAGATNISGVNYTVDDDEVLMAEARTKAIENAKEKAQKLAKDLDVDLGNLISFYEEQGQNMPMAMEAGYDGGVQTRAVLKADLPRGQDKISVTVSLTYKID
jgi:uncharacterized protein YggE